jgi:hypothetical protein
MAQGFLNLEVKVDFGIITSFEKRNKEIISYRVKLENYHQELEEATGIPIFSFGYNSYTFLVGSRVVCLIKDSNFNKVFIIGQTYDPAISRGGFAPDPGEISLVGSGSDRSGIGPLGKNDVFHSYAGSSYLKFDSKKINISIGNDFIIDGSNSLFSLSTDANKNGFLIKSGVFNFIGSNGFNFFSNSGQFYLEGKGFSYYEGTKKDADFSVVNSVHRRIGLEALDIFGTYSFEAGNGKIKGKTYTVDWNVISGSYGIRLGTGDFKINLTNVSGAEVSFKIGVGPLYLSQFIFDQSVLEVKIGAALPDSLKLGGGSLSVKVGNFPGLQTEFLLEGSNAELKVKGLIGSSTFTHGSSSIKFENTGTTGSASFEIANGKLTLKSASKALGGKITLDGEVEITGNVTVKGSDGITVSLGDVKAGPTSISLKNHKHATSIPGGPTPPLPG